MTVLYIGFGQTAFASIAVRPQEHGRTDAVRGIAHLSSRVRFRLIGSSRCSAANSRHRNFANILRHLIAPLHGGAPGDNRVPALHVRIGVEIDSLPFVARDPWPDGDVRDGVVVGDEFVLGEPAVKHAVESMRLLEVALFRVGCLTLVVFHKVMDLPNIGPGPPICHISHSSTRNALGLTSATTCRSCRRDR